jgi:hypothetical protein
VIVGFFENDIIDNYPVVPPRRVAVIKSRAMSFLKRHVYSLELYKRMYLTLQWKLSASDEYRKRLEHLGTEESLVADIGVVADSEMQQLTPYERLTEEQVRRNECEGGERPSPTLIPDIERDSGWPDWLRAVGQLQELHRSGSYRIVFFLNVVPPVCPDRDFFYDGGSSILNRFFLGILGNGTPALSVFDTFLHRRPSQMPYARGHAIGNSNATKAEALFLYLTAEDGPLRRALRR